MKKQIWQNRTVAWVLFAACVVFSLSFSGGRALYNLRLETEQIFYQGVHADGLSIDRDLEERAKCAYNLASTALNYASIDSASARRARDASDALAAAKTVSEKAKANAECQRAVEDLYTLMENADLSQSDMSFASKQYKEFQSRADTISRDVYNERATAFNEALSGFPAQLIGLMSGVRQMELFEG